MSDPNYEPEPDDGWFPPEEPPQDMYGEYDGGAIQWADPFAAPAADPPGFADPVRAARPSRYATGLEALRTVYGYDAFRGDQAEVVDQVISGGDAIVLMPTGGGKSVCYQVPALVREGTGLVVSPLIALMHDQVEALRANGVAAAYLNSTQDPSRTSRASST
jgi:ATP-dependent DNA helicase RecQ